MQFAVSGNTPLNAGMAHRFALAAAVALGYDQEAIEVFDLLQFDTSDIDDLLLPEHLPEN